MAAIVSVNNLSKVYKGGFEALKNVSLDIEEGEIIALLGPNGAGKTTLISTICGIVDATGGSVTVGGHDIRTSFRQARKLIGLVPQDIMLEPFEKVVNTVRFSRGLFGKPRNDVFIEDILTRLSLWDNRDTQIMALSGGMKRRTLIAKALSHEPRVLFLDEPSAGVDVELRKDMWAIVRDLRAEGVTIILTTHYIEEAETMADRIAVINNGRIRLVEDKVDLMTRMGAKEMRIELQSPVSEIPESLTKYALTRTDDPCVLVYTYDTQRQRTGITTQLSDLLAAGMVLRDVQTDQSSLEDIFVSLVGEAA